MSKSALACFMALLLICSPQMVRADEKDYSVTAETGLGFDSNVFLSPGKSYFDPFEQRVVNPERQSGFFVPLALRADLTSPLDSSNLTTSLSFKGSHYIEERLNNADTYRVSLGSELDIPLRKTEKGSDRLLIEPAVVYNKQVYFDRDTGLDKTTRLSRADLGDRYMYWRYGVDAELRGDASPVKYALKARGRVYDYEEVPVISSLDYTYYLLGADVGLDLAKSTALKLSYSYYVRNYREREARKLDGNLADGVNLIYAYYEAGISIRHSVNKKVTVYLDFEQIRRRDEHLGYNDADKDRYGAKAIFHGRKDLLVKMELAYWDRSYPRAFAFDDPGFPRKSYHAWEGSIRVDRPLKKPWMLWGEYEFTDQRSSDPRYDYERNQISAGVSVVM